MTEKEMAVMSLLEATGSVKCSDYPKAEYLFYSLEIQGKALRGVTPDGWIEYRDPNSPSRFTLRGKGGDYTPTWGEWHDYKSKMVKLKQVASPLSGLMVTEG